MKLFFKYLLLSVLILSGSAVVAQGDAKKDKIEALRADFIKKKVPMTAKESEAFWPLFNEMNDKLDAARNTFKAQYGKTTEFATDKEAEAYLNAEIGLKLKEYELYRDYFEKFKKIMPAKKVAAVRKAEEEFRKELIKIAKTG